MAQAMLPPWLVGNLSYGDLCVAVSDGLSAIHWAQRHHLLPDSKNCPHCGRGMNLADRGTGPEGLGWRCPRKGCRKEVSLRVGTFFEGINRRVLGICRVIAVVTLSGSHLEIATILRIIHLWSTKTPVGKMAFELSVSSFSL